MTLNWRDAKLGDVIELKRGYDLPQQNRRKGSVPLVSSSGITDFHSEAAVNGPGVVTGRYGTLGQVFYIEHDFWPLNTTLYVRDFKGNDPRFISYFLRSLNFHAYSDKAAVPGLNRNHLHQADVRVPSEVGEQRAIAHILGTLDDKIDLNRRMNQTLEVMARTIFKSWFIDFEPVRAKASAEPPDSICHRLGLTPGLLALFPDRVVDSEFGEIPEGWQVKPLDEIADYRNGLALQKFPPESETEWLPVIKIAQLKSGSIVGADRASHKLNPDYLVDDGDVLFSWSGSLEVDVWCGGRGALNQHLFKVTSARYPKWFFFHWTLQHLPHFRTIAAGKAVTMGHIQRSHLTRALCAVPSGELLNQADGMIGVLFQYQIAKRKESRILSTTRDALLPKLLSGEIAVPLEHVR